MPSAPPVRRRSVSRGRLANAERVDLRDGWLHHRPEKNALLCSAWVHFSGASSAVLWILSGRPMPSKTAKCHVAESASQPVSQTELMKEIEQ